MIRICSVRASPHAQTIHSEESIGSSPAFSLVVCRFFLDYGIEIVINDPTKMNIPTLDKEYILTVPERGN